MPYVQRNGLGQITATYGALQPGLATEFLPATHADVVAFLQRIAAIEADGLSLKSRLDTLEQRLSIVERKP